EAVLYIEPHGSGIYPMNRFEDPLYEPVSGHDRLIQGTFDLPGPDETADTESAARAPETERSSYRTTLAGWPMEWRERWGRRANALEDQGLGWREAEARAFAEINDQRLAAKRARIEANLARRRSSRSRGSETA